MTITCSGILHIVTNSGVTFTFSRPRSFVYCEMGFDLCVDFLRLRQRNATLRIRRIAVMRKSLEAQTLWTETGGERGVLCGSDCVTVNVVLSGTTQILVTLAVSASTVDVAVAE